MKRKPLTWGDIYYRWLARGFDHGWAAYAADRWAMSRARRTG